MKHCLTKKLHLRLESSYFPVIQAKIQTPYQ